MSKKMQLQIPQPCHENWDAMSPKEQGRYCASCKKVVVDFTDMSDAQVLAYFKKPQGSVCGRFYSDQLERPLTPPPKRLPWIRYFFSILVPAYLFSCRSQTQGKVMKDTDQEISNRITKGETTEQMVPLVGMLVREEIEIVHSADTSQPERSEEPTNDYLQRTNMDTTPVKDTGCTYKAEPPVYIYAYPPIRCGANRSLFTGKDTSTFKIERTFYPVNTVHHNNNIDAAVLQSKTVALENNPVTGPTMLTKNIVAGGVIAGVPVRKGNKHMNIIAAKKDTVRAFEVYPNPATPASLATLSWKDKETGSFAVHLVSESGQTVYSREFVGKKQTLMSFSLPPLAAGTYFLSLVQQETGAVFTEKLVIAAR
jgi:hypothetical protein